MEYLEPLEKIYEILELLIARYGALGIAAAMFAESAGLPFSSTIVVLTSGSMILSGKLSFWEILIASTIGITAGSIFSYLLGLLGSMLGKAVKSRLFFQQNIYSDNVSNKPGSRTMNLLHRYGNFSIFMAQLWGFSRTFISYPAGAMHMNIFLFVVYTFFGGALFSTLAISFSILLTGTMGLTLKTLKTLAGYSPWILVALLLIVVLLVWLYRRKKISGSLPDFTNFGRYLKNKVFRN